jgi:hypothetical protein
MRDILMSSGASFASVLGLGLGLGLGLDRLQLARSPRVFQSTTQHTLRSSKDDGLCKRKSALMNQTRNMLMQRNR